MADINDDYRQKLVHIEYQLNGTHALLLNGIPHNNKKKSISRGFSQIIYIYKIIDFSVNFTWKSVQANSEFRKSQYNPLNYACLL